MSEVAKEIVDAGRRLFQEGVLAGSSGNLSVRRGDHLWVTPTGIAWDRLAPEHISVLDADGRLLAGAAPSSEAPLHRLLYALRPEVSAVAHTHSHFATVFAVLRQPIEAVHYLLAFGGRRIEVAEYACFGSEQLAKNAVRALGNRKAVLLANHGVVAVGATLSEACTVASCTEEVARLQFHCRAIGTPHVLGDADLADVEARLAGYGPRLG